MASPLFQYLEKLGLVAGPAAGPSYPAQTRPARCVPFAYRFSRLTTTREFLDAQRQGAALESRLICDSSAFRRDDPNFSRELLGARRVEIVPGALGELRAVLSNAGRSAQYTQLAQLLFPDGKHLTERIEVIGPNLVESIKPSIGRYVQLLSIRKRVLEIEIRHFRSEKGRDPDTGELSALRRQLDRFGPRAAALARKQHASEGVADEALPVIAVALALASAQDVVVVADDSDVHEQFYKFTSLLRDDYAAHLLAHDLLAHSSTYGPRLALTDYHDLDPLIRDKRASFAVERPLDLGYLFEGCVHFRTITVVQPRIGGEVVQWAAVPALLEFLQTQSKSSRNTDRFGDLNAYIALPARWGGVDAPEGRAYAFFIADRIAWRSHGAEGETLPIFEADVQRTIFDFETLSPLSLAESMYDLARGAIEGGNASEAEAAFKRLVRFSDRNPEEIPAAGRAKAVFGHAVSIEERGALERAIAVYDSLIKHHGGTRDTQLQAAVIDARTNKGRALMALRRTGEAIGEFEVALTMAFRNGHEHATEKQALLAFNLAQAHVQAQNTSAGLRAYDTLMLVAGHPIPERLLSLATLALFGKVILLAGALAAALELQKACECLASLHLGASKRGQAEVVRQLRSVVESLAKRDLSEAALYAAGLVVAVGASSECKLPLDFLTSQAYCCGCALRESLAMSRWPSGIGTRHVAVKGVSGELVKAKTRLLGAVIRHGMLGANMSMTEYEQVKAEWASVSSRAVREVGFEAHRLISLFETTGSGPVEFRHDSDLNGGTILEEVSLWSIAPSSRS